METKYLVTVDFFIKADHRGDAWKLSEEICTQHLRGLATVIKVSMEPDPKPQDIIAVNEPIRDIFK